MGTSGKSPSRGVREGRGPVCPTISTKGQSSPQPCADVTKRGQSPNNTGRKGATISTNEAGGLKAFCFIAARPPWEQSVLLPWLPGSPGRKGFGDRRRVGVLEKPGGRRRRGGRARDGSRRAWCWLGGLLSSISPPKTLGSGRHPTSAPLWPLVHHPLQCP